MKRYTLTWKGWRFYVDGNLCVATNGAARLTVKLKAMPSDQHAFFLAVGELKNGIRDRGPRGSIAQRAAATR